MSNNEKSNAIIIESDWKPARNTKKEISEDIYTALTAMNPGQSVNFRIEDYNSLCVQRVVKRLNAVFPTRVFRIYRSTELKNNKTITLANRIYRHK